MEKYFEVIQTRRDIPKAAFFSNAFQGVLKFGLPWGHQVGRTRRLRVALSQLGCVHWVGPWNFPFLPT